MTAMLLLGLLATARPEAWGYDPAAWRASASSQQANLRLAWDDNRKTAWRTAAPMQAGD
ncbi:MAG: hypothetical protein HUU35_19310, partial [Armatimonadetes bacterium]|nr:hypothetical protein [Armatimonadota bacterium]